MDRSFSGSNRYVASDELMMAVNIAMTLQKPLLIKGEPGTGKTMLETDYLECQVYHQGAGWPVCL